MSMTDAQRATLVSNIQYLVSWGHLIPYQQVRPFPLLSKAALTANFKKGVPLRGVDCSAFCTLAYFISGLKDPTGDNFSGFGNSATMLKRLPHYTNPVNAHPGALVVFGADQPLAKQHVCLVLKQGKNPQLASHGGPLSGVKLLSLSQEQSAHTGSTVFLDVNSLA